MDISVIMPVYNAAHLLPKVLPPLIAMRERGEVLEVIAVDDVSTDNSREVAAGLGARVIESPKNGGPGAARNIAAREARGDVLWFVDSDVIAYDDAVTHIRAALADPAVVSVFGSYDDAPPAQNFASQYKNLVHHFYHHRGQREASTFWAGCGAIRKKEFLAAGGFDIELYKRPSIEDIELGYRLRDAGGRIVLAPELLSTHLKRWTLKSVIYTDVMCRAVPWARLMLSRAGMTDDLNVGKAERLRALLAGVLVLSLFAPVFGAALAWLPLAVLIAAIAANWDLFTFFSRRRGIAFALAGLLFHQLYYLYAGAAFAWCWLEARTGRAPNPATAG